MSGRFAPRAMVGWVTVLSAGASLLVVAGAMVVRDRQAAADFGSTSSSATKFASSSPLSPPSSARSSSHPVTPLTAPLATSATSAAPAAPAVDAGDPTVQTARPVRIEIPALGVRAVVIPVHTSNGVLGVPEDPHEVGWWAEGAQLGAPAGTVTIDGHVDSAAAGEGALFHLASLRGGDIISLTTASGRTLRYAVTGRRTYPKSGGLPADLFRGDGSPRLVLITCGGPFDSSSRSYRDNVVAFAVPV